MFRLMKSVDSIKKLQHSHVNRNKQAAETPAKHHQCAVQRNVPAKIVCTDALDVCIRSLENTQGVTPGLCFLKQTRRFIPSLFFPLRARRVCPVVY